VTSIRKLAFFLSLSLCGAGCITGRPSAGAGFMHLFVRNLVERLLAYALRRGVEFYDTPAVKQVVAALEANEYRGVALVDAVVASFPFQYRRNETSGARR